MHDVVVSVDPDVKRVCDFMLYGSEGSAGINPAKLIAVARNVSDLAPLLWGHYLHTNSEQPLISISRSMRQVTECSSQLPLPPTAI